METLGIIKWINEVAIHHGILSCAHIIIDIFGRFYKHGWTLIVAWISNYIHYKVWDEIIYPFLNFNGATVEV